MKIKRMIIILVVIIIIISLTPAYVGRFIYWNIADINDYKKFPKVEIQNGAEKFQFYKNHVNFQFEIPHEFISDKEYNSFETYLKKTETLVYLVIKNDTIIYEQYFNDYNESTLHTSFSVTKSFISALLGIAIGEGAIKDLDQPVTDYYKDLKDPGFSKIRIKDLLTMRSGIKFNESYINPFGTVAKFYYGRNLTKYVRNLKIESPPDQTYNYAAANTQLLSFIIEKATHQKISDYLQEKIWKSIGMEHNAQWNMDSKKHNNIKAFCCLTATVRDFAKFGRLYLNNGNWNGKQIIPEKWIRDTRTVTNDSRDSQNYPYTYQWRSTINDALFAKGILGQSLYIDYKNNMIFLRLGKGGGEIDWPEFAHQLTGQL
ncbi:serine hydrolase domain-containing protein [candidate division KSB1 bacterium]